MSTEFAIQILKLTDSIKGHYALSNQLERSGTSIGTNIRKGESEMKLKFLLAVIAVILILSVIWISSLIQCEVLTHTYFDDFDNAYTQNTMLGEMEYFKVIHCDGNTAEVYYVSKDMTDANVLSFKNIDGTWVETSWRTIWSTTGSASEVIYPYWWHFIYGGL